MTADTSVNAHAATPVTALDTLTRIPPQRGRAFTLKKGEVLRVIDPQGEQVSDLFAFAADDHRCALSSGRSIDYAGRIYLTVGDILYANDSRPMFTIVTDTVGRHDFLLTPCSQEMFEILYKHKGHHHSCFENLLTSRPCDDLSDAACLRGTGGDHRT